MKLSKLWALLKASKYITKWEGSDTEWLSDGRAFFPVYGLPTLTEQALRTMLDVNEDKWTSYHYREEGELPFFDLDNFQDDEELHVSKVTFTVWGVEFVALTKGLDIYLVSMKELKPLGSESLSFYLRDGFVAVKEGMVLRAVITPEIITEDIILAELMSIATKLHGAARDRQLQEFAERYQESEEGQQIFDDMEDEGDEG